MIVEGKDGESVDKPIKTVLTKLCSLFGLWRLEKHLTTLYQGKDQSKLFLQSCIYMYYFASWGLKSAVTILIYVLRAFRPGHACKL